jgi:hypothetical protein
MYALSLTAQLKEEIVYWFIFYYSGLSSPQLGSEVLRM